MSVLNRYRFRSGYVISWDVWKQYLAEGHHIDFSDIKPRRYYEEEVIEEERPLAEEEDVEFRVSLRCQQVIRRLRHAAPLETRVRLVLPHSCTRRVQHEKFGERHRRYLFIPTGSGGPRLRNMGPREHDRHRIEIFIDVMNGLIKDEFAREAAGFKFSEPDFKFEVIPDSALSIPFLNPDELKELLRAGRECVELYGLPVRDFLEPYRS